MSEARRDEPVLSAAVGAAIRIHGQRYIHPPRFMDALAASFRARGGQILTGVTVTHLRDEGAAVAVADTTGTLHHFDAVVVANGAELGDLVNPFGVRHRVQAGRGYSFTVEAQHLPAGPVYFPTQRIACTPLRSSTGHRLRVAGMMEFQSPSAPLDPRRIEVMVAALAPLTDGLDLHDRHEEWVGSRPCTVDGLPLVGATRSKPGVRCRRSRHVGHRPRPRDRTAARPAGRDRRPRPSPAALRSHPLNPIVGPPRSASPDRSAPHPRKSS